MKLRGRSKKNSCWKRKR